MELPGEIFGMMKPEHGTVPPAGKAMLAPQPPRVGAGRVRMLSLLLRLCRKKWMIHAATRMACLLREGVVVVVVVVEVEGRLHPLYGDRNTR